MKGWARQVPKTVRIAAFDVTIELKPGRDMDGARGLWVNDSHKILLEEDMPSRHEAVNVLLHEITHAIYSAYGLPKRPKEEQVASVMGVAWTQIFRDNPKLLSWLKRTLPQM